jgi:hypothetical protein
MESKQVFSSSILLDALRDKKFYSTRDYLGSLLNVKRSGKY